MTVVIATSVVEDRLWRYAGYLAVFTVVYNLAEGLVSVWFGLQDEALTLFGFGADSFIEMISALGVGHMVIRLRRNGHAQRDQFEKAALRITGSAFYAFVVVLVASASLVVITGHKPETTLSGMIISLVSIAFMWLLIQAKVRVGIKLNSQPILADAECSRVCLRMSLVLLLSSSLYLLFEVGYLDAAGALALSWFSHKEGRECFQKAKRTDLTCADDCC